MSNNQDTNYDIDKYDIIEPYSNFVFYEVSNPEIIQDQLPDKINFIPFSVFGEKKQYYLIFRFYKQSNNLILNSKIEVLIRVNKYEIYGNNSESSFSNVVIAIYIK